MASVEDNKRRRVAQPKAQPKALPKPPQLPWWLRMLIVQERQFQDPNTDGKQVRPHHDRRVTRDISATTPFSMLPGPRMFELDYTNEDIEFVEDCWVDMTEFLRELDRCGLAVEKAHNERRANWSAAQTYTGSRGFAHFTLVRNFQEELYIPWLTPG